MGLVKTLLPLRSSTISFATSKVDFKWAAMIRAVCGNEAKRLMICGQYQFTGVVQLLLNAFCISENKGHNSHNSLCSSQAATKTATIKS